MGDQTQTYSQDEVTLVKSLVSGDKGAFEKLYRQHNQGMIRFATAILRNRSTAEEVTQDTWVAVLRNIGQFEGRSSLAGWIFAILSNKARTRAAREGRSLSFEEDDDGGLAAAFDGMGRWKSMPELWEEITPERLANDRLILEHVNRAIEMLPPAQRAVLILRGQYGFDSADVGRMLGISEGNVRVLLHRARFALRTGLDKLMRK